MIDKIKAFITDLNEKGITIPLITNHGTGSVSLTILVLSVTCVIMALFKYKNLNFWEALAWNITSAVLYYNKKAKINKDGFEIGTDDKNDKTES